MDVPRRLLGDEQGDLRRTVAERVNERLEQLATDTVTMILYSGSEGLDSDYCLRLGRILLHLLSSTIRDGRVSGRDGTVAALYRATLERSFPTAQVFTLTYLIGTLGYSTNWQWTRQSAQRASPGQSSLNWSGGHHTISSAPIPSAHSSSQAGRRWSIS